MIMNPTAIKHVVVDGHSLTLESFVAIARYNATVELAPSALEAMQKSRALAEKIAAEGRVAYGITTGFGEFQKVAVPKEMSNQLSTNLSLSHCTAAGEPYADEIVRGMMLLRANALCGGVSGVRPLLVEMLLEMLRSLVGSEMCIRDRWLRIRLVESWLLISLGTATFWNSPKPVVMP